MAKRGAALSVFAILFVLLAVSNFIKPFSHDPSTAFIFLGRARVERRKQF